MEKRNLYQPSVKKGGSQKPPPEETPPEEKFKEDEIFKVVEKKPVEEPQVDHIIDIDSEEPPPELKTVVQTKAEPLPVPQKKKRKPREMTPALRENLRKMNEKSAEVRRKKKEERLAKEAKIKEELEKELQQTYPEYPRPEPKTTAIDAMKETPPPPVETAQQRNVHVPQQVSVDRDTSIDNYDRLIQGVVGALKSDKYYSQMERDIRLDERRKAEKEYGSKLRQYEEEQHRRHQRDVGYSLLTGGNGRPVSRQNSTFMRTQMLRDRWKR
jgi:hypothetical protein